MQLLFLFSGPAERIGSFREFAKVTGQTCGFNVSVIWIDVVNGPEFDMADQTKFEALLEKVRRNEFAAVLMSPPCSTFSRARGRPGGPRKVRGPAGPDRYGLKDLKPKEKEGLRLGTLLAVRAA